MPVEIVVALIRAAAEILVRCGKACIPTWDNLPSEPPKQGDEAGKPGAE